MSTTNIRKRTQSIYVEKNQVRINFFLFNFLFEFIESINQSLIVNLLDFETSKTSIDAKNVNSN